MLSPLSEYREQILKTIKQLNNYIITGYKEIIKKGGKIQKVDIPLKSYAFLYDTLPREFDIFLQQK